MAEYANLVDRAPTRVNDRRTKQKFIKLSYGTPLESVAELLWLA